LLAGGWAYFNRVEVIKKLSGNKIETCILSVKEFEEKLSLYPESVALMYERLCANRPSVAGISMTTPACMAIINTTPDSFSDGGLHDDVAVAFRHVQEIAEFSDIIDIGGESTRPEAKMIDEGVERDRVFPLLEKLNAIPDKKFAISVDTRKSLIMQESFSRGARIMNDVSALSFDPESGNVVSELMRLDPMVCVCLMHAWDFCATSDDSLAGADAHCDVVLDVYDALEERIAYAVSCGIPRQRIILDPGIGFGKTTRHNLALLKNIAIFHALGLPILVGLSRKRFLGEISGEQDAKRRDPETMVASMFCVEQGVQIHRIHNPRMFSCTLCTRDSLVRDSLVSVAD
jgi:dihydropteroate synthase